MCVRPGCLGEPGQAASGVPRRARRAAGALRGRTQARLLPPQLCRGTEGGRAIAVLIFFRTIRISVGNFCRRRRGAGEACGVVGRTPSPPSGRASRSASLTWGTQHPTPGRCRGPAGAALLALGGGVTPYPPAPGRGFCNAVGVVMHGAHRSPGPLQWQHRAGPLLAGSEGPRRAGLPRSAPLRPALEGSRVPACLPDPARLPGAREAARTLEPLTLPPSLLLAPRSAAWKCRCSARSVERGTEKPRGRAACGLSGSVGASASWVRPRALGLPERDRGGGVE